MSFRRMPVYSCDICAKEEIGVLEIYGWRLPKEWHGSSLKFGHCLCGDCFKIFQKMKEKNS